MNRAAILALLGEQSDDTLEALAALLPAIADLRVGGQLAVKHFGEYHRAGLASSVIIQSRPGKRERERVEASLVTGHAVQLILDFDAQRTA